MKHTRLFLILNSAFLISTLSSCYSWYEKKVPMDTESTQLTLKDFLYEAPQVTSLEAPTQVIASQGLYSGSIKVNWNDVENATSYRIERAVIKPDSTGNYAQPDEADFEVLNKYVYSTTYDDVILSKPKSNNVEYTYRYYYRICAENLGKGLESSDFTEISNPKTRAYGFLFSPVTNVEAWKGEDPDEIRISWERVQNASSYSIYRGTKAENKDYQGMELLDTVSGNCNFYVNKIQTDDERGKEFYFKVTAGLSTGSEAAPSTSVLGYSSVAGAPFPPKPDTISITNQIAASPNSLEITWGPGDANGGTLKNYAVYRTSSVDSNYTLLAKCAPTANSYVDKSVKSGIIYYYYIQTITEDNDGKIQKSSFSKTGETSENPVFGFVVSAPADVDIFDGEETGKVILRWTPALGSEEPYNLNFTYNIYADTEQNGSYSEVIQTGIKPSDCTFTDGYFEYKVEKRKFFKVTSSNENLVESTLSKAAAPSPDAPINVVASRTSNFPEMDGATCNKNGVYPVKITWEKPATDNPYAYHIYRSTKPDSSFRKLNDNAITSIDADGKYYFVDNNETARAGTFYYYKVVSLNVLEKGKNGSDPYDERARGYGMITREQWFREYNKSIMRSQSKLTLMHKSNDMDKLGSETINGDISGTLSYKAAIAGLGAEITMHYENYCDFYINDDSSMGPFFVLTGNTDTTSNMSANGTMHEKVNCTGMYPGYAIYDNLQIKGGAAGGGYYLVETYDLNGKVNLPEGKVDWTVGEEH